MNTSFLISVLTLLLEI